MSDINELVSKILFEESEDDEEENGHKHFLLGLLGGGLATGAAIGSQTHTGKAVYNGVKGRVQSMTGNKLGALTSYGKAAWHGIQSPMIRSAIKNKVF